MTGTTITTRTTTATEHSADLAGGVKAVLDPAVFGATLTLTDGEPRVLVLALHPERLQALVDWDGRLGYDRLPHGAGRTLVDVTEFCKTARIRAKTHGIFDLEKPLAGDFATVRGLAVAWMAREDR